MGYDCVVLVSKLLFQWRKNLLNFILFIIVPIKDIEHTEMGYAVLLYLYFNLMISSRMIP